MTQSTLSFCKLYSAGQDFIIIDGRRGLPCELEQLANYACNRYSGIGAEAIVSVETSQIADFKLRAATSSGSCRVSDNALRCAARFIQNMRIVPHNSKRFFLETVAERVQVETIGKGEKVRVSMGIPTFDGPAIPVAALGEQFNKTINVDGSPQTICAVGMGEAHGVLFLTGVDYLNIAELGAKLERHVYFPNGCEVDFAEILNPELIKLRMWERGNEEIIASGHSCCAVAAAAMRLNWTARKLLVRTAAGEFEVFWNDNESNIYLTGPAEIAFEGEIELEGILAEKKESLLN